LGFIDHSGPGSKVFLTILNSPNDLFAFSNLSLQIDGFFFLIKGYEVVSKK
jgi:hypothetical protein